VRRGHHAKEFVAKVARNGVVQHPLELLDLNVCDAGLTCGKTKTCN
jgi:hypothetical protein